MSRSPSNVLQVLQSRHFESPTLWANLKQGSLYEGPMDSPRTSGPGKTHSPLGRLVAAAASFLAAVAELISDHEQKRRHKSYAWATLIVYYSYDANEIL